LRQGDTCPQRVQEVLDTQRRSGERCWRHHHYLRGSVFCICDRRLVYTRARGRRGGIYEYFVCSGRMQGTCDQPHHRVEAIERAIEDEYRGIELTESRRRDIRDEVQTYVEKLDARSEPERQEVAQQLKQLAAQEKNCSRPTTTN
jgi:site-specific DNA recombinase